MYGRTPTALIRCAGLAIGFALALGAPAAQARVPKWLLPPHRPYVLTYQAKGSGSGNAVDSYPHDTSDPCSDIVTTKTASSHWDVQVVYRFVFGRAHSDYARHPVFAAVWTRTQQSASGAVDSTRDDDPPQGCPPITGGYYQHETCHSPVKRNGAVMFDLASNSTDNPTRFAIELDSVLLQTGDPACGLADFPPPFPDLGKIRFSAGGVMRRRTFQGQVFGLVGPGGSEAPYPFGPQSTQGTNTSAYGAQETWSSSSDSTGSFTLKPGA